MPRMMLRPRHALMIAALGSSALVQGAGVTPIARMETIGLGRNAAGETCVATRNWTDPAVPDRFDRAYIIACSGVAASRPLGTVRAVRAAGEAQKALDAQFDCGPESAVLIAGQNGSARRCYDRVTGLESLRLDMVRGDRRYTAAGTPVLLPLLEEAFAVIAEVKPLSADATRTPQATIALTAFAPRPGAALPGADGMDSVAPFDAATALAQGISLNHKGLHVDASRVLNDALSRLSPSAPAALRAELELEAGLADSNIRFSDAAAGHFAAADAIFTAEPAVRSAFLARKRDTYVAFDAINRHAFAEALATLDRVASAPQSAEQPLRDPDVLRLLNQPAGNGTATALAVPTLRRSRNSSWISKPNMPAAWRCWHRQPTGGGGGDRARRRRLSPLVQRPLRPEPAIVVGRTDRAAAGSVAGPAGGL